MPNIEEVIQFVLTASKFDRGRIFAALNESRDDEIKVAKRQFYLIETEGDVIAVAVMNSSDDFRVFKKS